MAGEGVEGQQGRHLGQLEEREAGQEASPAASQFRGSQLGCSLSSFCTTVDLLIGQPAQTREECTPLPDVVSTSQG